MQLARGVGYIVLRLGVMLNTNLVYVNKALDPANGFPLRSA